MSTLKHTDISGFAQNLTKTEVKTTEMQA